VLSRTLGRVLVDEQAYERRAELHHAFLHLGCAIICRRLLRVL
jgi:hypothetical protein